MTDLSDLLGTPYKHHGRDRSGFDCYGLVIEVERRLGVELSDFDYAFRDYPDTENVYRISEKDVRWKETDSPRYGDVVLFFDGRNRVIHAAVYIESMRILHCDVHGTQMANLRTFYYQNWKAYKWQR